MKKNVKLLAIFALVVLLLAGCDKEDKEKESSKDYSAFLDNLKDSKMESYQLSYHEVGWNDVEYVARLSSDGNLTVTLRNRDNTKMDIAEDVVLFRLISTGNGGFNSLYYVTEEGKVYKADVDLVLANNEKLAVKELTDVKNVVNIIQSGDSNAHYPLFVDIDGNVLKSKLAME